MLILSNDAVASCLDSALAIDALREAYRDLADRRAAYTPRVDLYGPVPAPMDAYRWGSMSGIAVSAGVVATRIKSDVVAWGEGREDKHCIEPGTYSGIILLYRIADGAPLALLNDGLIQHVRVGAAVAIGVERLTSPTAARLGLLGSGGMAWSCLDALRHVRSLDTVLVHSPTRSHLDDFVARARAAWDIEVRAVGSAREAVDHAEIVVTATNSLEPTIDPAWLAPGSHTSFVSRREFPAGAPDGFDVVYRLGDETLPVGTDLDGLDHFRGGYAGLSAGDEEFRDGLPRARRREASPESRLAHLPAGEVGWVGPSGRSALVAVGTQGVQFAALAAAVVRRATAAGAGDTVPDAWFLQDIKD